MSVTDRRRKQTLSRPPVPPPNAPLRTGSREPEYFSVSMPRSRRYPRSGDCVASPGPPAGRAGGVFMRLLLIALMVTACFGALASVAAGEHITIAPNGVDIVPPGQGGRVPCDIQLRYDDGIDDTPGSGPTLGWYAPGQYQFLGVRFTPPADQS